MDFFQILSVITRKGKRLFFIIIARDLINILRFGLDAPRYSQTLFLNPQEISLAVLPDLLSREDTGKVMGGDWDLHVRQLHDIKKIAMVKARIREGKSWEAAGAYQIMNELIQKHHVYDDCKTKEDVLQRYERLDRVIESIKSGGFLSMSRVRKGTFRESGGVYIHIGRNGEYIFGIGGCHRLAIAQALRLECIPVQVGVVHEKAIVNGHWKKLNSDRPRYKRRQLRIARVGSRSYASPSSRRKPSNVDQSNEA